MVGIHSMKLDWFFLDFILFCAVYTTYCSYCNPVKSSGFLFISLSCVVIYISLLKFSVVVVLIHRLALIMVHILCFTDFYDSLYQILWLKRCQCQNEFTFWNWHQNPDENWYGESSKAEVSAGYHFRKLLRLNSEYILIQA